MNQIISASQAAKLLGVSRQQITWLIRRGKLKAFRSHDAGKTTGYKINIDDVHELLCKRNAPTIEKQCPRCKQIKSLHAFNHCKQRKNGHGAYCRQCRKEIYQENREHILAQKKEYTHRNKKKISKRMQAYYKEHGVEIRAKRQVRYIERKEEITAAKRKRYATDTKYRERRKQHSKQYRQDNPEKVRQASHNYMTRDRDRYLRRQRESYAKHREKRRDSKRQYYRQHADECRRKSREWAKDNPDKREAYNAIRRAKKAGYTLKAKPINRQEIIERDNAICYICGKGPLENSETHLDHVIPLSKGGTHTSENLRVACVACNCKKHNKSLDEVRQLIAEGRFLSR